MPAQVLLVSLSAHGALQEARKTPRPPPPLDGACHYRARAGQLDATIAAPRSVAS